MFFLQMALVEALVSGDWLFIQKSEHESRGPFQNVIAVPSQHTLNVGVEVSPCVLETRRAHGATKSEPLGCGGFGQGMV